MDFSTIDQQALDLHNKLKDAVNEGRKELFLEPRTYYLRGGLLEDQFCFVSNNDEGLKRILFDFDGVDNFVLDGCGSHLVFFGEIMPFRIARSSRVTIRNFTIDWHRPFFSQGILTKKEDKKIIVEIDQERYPLAVDRGRLIAYDKQGWQTNQLWNMLAFNPDTKELVQNMPENWHLSCYHKAESLGDGVFSIEADFLDLPPQNTTVVFMHGNRVASGIFIDSAQNISVENVTIHHATGMALIAQVSENITLQGFKVTPSEGRLFSAWVDATHFVDCKGHILLNACRLEGQFDDALNIHGAFWKVVEHREDSWIRAKIMHPQQIGVKNLLVGDKVALFERKTQKILHITDVVEVKTLNKSVVDIQLGDLPAGLLEIDLIICRYCKDTLLEIRGSHFGANRGRGLLLSIPGKILVENNYFHVDGAAIEITSDSEYWWESGPVEDVEIRNNTFDDCGFGISGKVLFSIRPELPHEHSDSIHSPIKSIVKSDSEQNNSKEKIFVHKNVRIHHNKIIRHNSTLILADMIDGLSFEDNEILWSEKYKRNENGEAIKLGENVKSFNKGG